jgi:hypothetical protein
MNGITTIREWIPMAARAAHENFRFAAFARRL